MSVKIELSFKSGIDKEILFELRDYFRKEMPGFEFDLKELPTLPGRMSVGEWVPEAILYATSVVSIEEGLRGIIDKGPEYAQHFLSNLKLLRDNFIKRKDLKQLDIVGTVRVGKTKKNFKINNNIDVQYINDCPYSLDTEHTYVLLVGCGKYKHSNIPDIPPAEENLNALYNIVVDKEYLGIPADHVTVSLDDTDEVIIDYLYEISKSKDIETFIFYYVGHGFCTGKNSYYLAASNTRKRKDFISSGINKEFIQDRILSQSPAKQKIAIIDACYSGLLAQGSDPKLFEKEVIGSYILTSSNAEEVSFYDKNEPYTYFTGALLHTIKKGIGNHNANISLDDLYVGTSEQLNKQKLQEPTYKNGLNIDPAKFIIFNNGSFSPESELNKPYAYIQEGKYYEAEFEFQKLLIKYPNNKELQEKTLELRNERIYVQLVSEGDRCYFELKDYANAADSYQKALSLKKDASVREKLNQCLYKVKIHHVSKSRVVKIIIRVIVPIIAIAISHHYSEPIIATIKKILGTGDSAQQITAKNRLREADSLFNKKYYGESLSIYDSLIDSLNIIQLKNIASLTVKGNEPNIKKDYKRAVNYYIRAFEKGDTSVADSIGDIYKKGGPGVPRDPTEAKKWHRKNGNKLSASMLGSIVYNQGEQFMKNGNTAKAVDCYSRAASMGNTNAMVALAGLYDEGKIGGTRKLDSVEIWYQKAVDKKDAMAMQYFGWYYEAEGKVKEAKKMYQQAVEYGNQNAQNDIDSLDSN